jgi:ribosome biogenesis GTPase
VCINKIDLADVQSLQPLVGQYSQLGYDVVLTDAVHGRGISQLRDLLRGQETVFAGQSGVGKSSLLNLVQPGLGQAISHVSEESGKGRHTTRVTQLLRIDGGGWLVDTPGVRTFQLWDIVPAEVEGLFVEFRPFVAHCRFPDCTHSHESGCAVKQAVQLKLISPRRYDNYLRTMTGDESLFSEGTSP